jgi:protein SCO1/2
MKRRISLALTLWLSVLFLAPVVSGAPGNPVPRVLVSARPIHSLVSGLMAGVAEPELIALSGPPYAYGLQTGQKEELEKADLVIWLGPELEPSLGDILLAPDAEIPSLELLAMERLKVLPARSGGRERDPLFWLDTRNMLILIDELSAALATLDPVRTHRYESNRQRVLRELSQLDRELEYGYRKVSAVPVFSYHDTHQYFEQAYAMKVAAIATSGGQETSTESLLAMRGLLADAPNPCVLTEAALPEPHIDLLLAGTSGRAVEIDSFGSSLEPGPDLYARMMREQFRAISNCIGGDSMGFSTEGAGSPEQTGSDALPHRIQGKYLLMNHFGEPVSNLDFSGDYQLIYFGYTFCPDICPTSLTTMTQALKILGPKAGRIQPLFISVDPARDTPEKMREYTAYFHPRLLGLTGPEEMIARVAEQFHVRYEKVVLEDRPAEQYAVDHTSSLFLLGPNSSFVAKFAHEISANDLAARLDDLIRY